MTKLGLLACVFAATGCPKRGGGDGFGTNEARSAGDALGASIEGGAVTFGPMVPATGAASDCATLSGDPTDTDGDNIPVNAVLTYACTATALGLTGTLSGTISVTDDMPNAAAWAFTGDADLEASLTGGGGASIVTSRVGRLVASQVSALGPFSLSHEVDVTTVFTSGGNVGPPRSATVVETGDWTLTFTPIVTWTPGSLIVTGELEAEGAWSVVVGGAEADATLSTPDPLTLDPTCETRVTSGTVVATLPDGPRDAVGRIEVSWTGCGQHAVSSN